MKAINCVENEAMAKPQAQKKKEETEPETWSLKGFLHEVKRIHKRMEDRRFAFILGAGASIDSKVKGASALANEWMEILFHRRHNTPNDKYEDWLKSNPLNLDDWDPEDLAKHYPQIFEQCFSGDHDSGYAALEDAITGRKPSLGYAVLAWILSSTNHKMVITTNFDNLVADAVSIYGGTYPHVIGHESLAHYAKPLPRRPIVAKIHRDLLTSPINTSEGTSALEDQWRKALKNIFRLYTPVFIGYGGNDGSLMNFLEALDINDISGRPFWCYYAPDGPPNDTIKQLMKKQNGALVPINGFDEFMLQMGEAIGFERQKHIAEIKKKSEQLIDQIQEQMLSLSKESKDEDIQEILQPQNKERSNWSWLDWALKIYRTSDQEEQETLYKEAIKLHPEEHQLLGDYAILLHKQGKLDEAEQYFLNTIELVPDSYYYLGKYAILLHNQGRLDEARQYYISALDLEPDYEDLAWADNEVVEISAYFVMNYATLLQEQGELIEAEHYYRRSIELEPNDADNLGNYANLLQELGKHEEAEQYYQQAIEAAPNHSNNLENYADFLKNAVRFEEANEVIQQALAIEPNDERLLKIKESIQNELEQLEEKSA